MPCSSSWLVPALSAAQTAVRCRRRPACPISFRAGPNTYAPRYDRLPPADCARSSPARQGSASRTRAIRRRSTSQYMARGMSPTQRPLLRTGPLACRCRAELGTRLCGRVVHRDGERRQLPKRRIPAAARITSRQPFVPRATKGRARRCGCRLASRSCIRTISIARSSGIRSVRCTTARVPFTTSRPSWYCAGFVPGHRPSQVLRRCTSFLAATPATRRRNVRRSCFRGSEIRPLDASTIEPRRLIRAADSPRYYEGYSTRARTVAMMTDDAVCGRGVVREKALGLWRVIALEIPRPTIRDRLVSQLHVDRQRSARLAR